LTTKIHGVVDAPGNPLHLFLSAGNEHDVKFAPQLLCTLTVEGAVVNANRGYDSQALVDWLKSRSAIACFSRLVLAYPMSMCFYPFLVHFS
jgi:hypothetical protein